MTIRYDFLHPKVKVSGIGRNLYILGTSEDGPVLEPIPIASPDHAVQVFGDENRGTLVKAFKEAYEVNHEISIYLMRITGKSATLDIDSIISDNTVDNLISFHSIYGGNKYNKISITFEYRESTDEYLLVFTLYDDSRVVYNLVNYATINELVNYINADMRSGIHPIMASTNHPLENIFSILTLYDNEPLFLSGGEDGDVISKDDLYIALDVAYDLLLGKPVDVINPTGVYLDDVHPNSIYGGSTYGSAYYSSGRDHLQLIDTLNGDKVVTYHEQLIDFSKKQMELGYMTHGVIGINPLDKVPSDIEHSNSYIYRLVETSIFRNRYGLMEFQSGKWVDKGFYISIVASEVLINPNTPNEYYTNGATIYASLLAGHFDSTTNLKLPETIKLRYDLPDEVHADLSKLGIVTFNDSISKGLVVNNGVTAARWSSELHNIANVRMIQVTIAFMNDTIEQLYENDHDPTIRYRLLDDLVKQRLLELKTLGVLKEYNYQIVFDSTDTAGAVLLELQTKYTVQGVSTSAEISYMGA